jgi:hypothetical protein
VQVRAAAISLQGRRLVVVATGPDLVADPAEANLTIETLEPVFGGVPVVLMALSEDDSPTYYGGQDLVRSLAGVPVDEMPWQDYEVGG